MHVQRRCAGHDDEPGDDVGEDASGHHIQPRSLEAPPGYAFFHDRRLQVELHPRSYRRSHDADHHVEISLIAKGLQRRRLHGRDRCVNPRRLRQYSSKNISHIEERRRQENLLYALVLAFDHDQPYDDRTHRHGRISRKPEQLEAGSNPDKLCHHIAEIGDQNPKHHQKRDTQSEFLADQVAQALAGHGPHAGTHLLHHDQRDRNRDHGPQQKMSELRPGGRIGQDAAGIIVDVRGNEPRTHHGKEQQDPALPTSQKPHAHLSQT